ncbi:MAG: YeeE/YedE thiosulfate transporter family protein [Bacteroidales bacterium]
MAPFIPEGLVNPQLNLFFALVLGIGFGYVLEQAGFSSSRKLAGVFYGYDFVVLRVFFTAGITAMTGLLFLSFMGWIDMSLVYINPLYLWSAVLGGAIMGLGFILGGYCPGTSVVAATVGRIDAMLFLAGSVIGIFIFGHFYNAWEPLYNGYFEGHPFIYETLGMSRAWFAFILVMVAAVAFAITQRIEDNINQTPVHVIEQRPSYVVPGGLLILAMVAMLFLPPQRKSNARELRPEALLAQMQDPQRYVTVEEAVYKIIKQDPTLILIDVRETEEYERFTLPGAINIRTQEILGRRYREFFRNSQGKRVFYGFGESAAQQAWLIAMRAGFPDVYILEGGLNGLFDELFNGSEKPEDPLNLDQEFRVRFLTRARQMFLEGDALPRPAATPTPIRTLIELETPGGRGGC